jgi:hypothetical protein
MGDRGACAVGPISPPPPPPSPFPRHLLPVASPSVCTFSSLLVHYLSFYFLVTVILVE